MTASDKTIQSGRTSSPEIANLDLLRTMAVGFVLARHLLAVFQDPATSYFHPEAVGLLGVMIFFVHTSLVLMMSLDRQGGLDREHFFRGYGSFMLRRVFRIFPLSAVTVLVAFFVLLPKGLYAHTFALSRPLLASNLFLVQNVAGYPSVIGPLWSLPIEAQMYLFLPGLYLIVQKWGYRLLGLVLWPASVVIGLSHYKFHWIPSLFVFAPFFIPGVISYDFMRRSGPRTVPYGVLPLAIAGFAIFMAMTWRLGAHYGFGYPVCIALAFLLGGLRDIPLHLTALRGFAKTIAKYSYGIYLFHDIYISLCFYHAPWLPGFLRLPVMLILTGVSAYLGYHVLEAPMIRMGIWLADSLSPRSIDLRAEKQWLKPAS